MRSRMIHVSGQEPSMSSKVTDDGLVLDTSKSCKKDEIWHLSLESHEYFNYQAVHSS